MLWRPHMPSQAGRRPGRFVTRTGLRPSASYYFATLSRSPQQGIATMKRLAIATLALALPACVGTTPPPAVEIRTVTIEKPVAVACVKASDLPAEPEKVAGKLTGDARRDLDTVSASALRLRSWGREMRAMLVGCSK